MPSGLTGGWVTSGETARSPNATRSPSGVGTASSRESTTRCLPHDPSFALDDLAPFDRLSIAERLDELKLDEEERAVLEAELESLASGPLAEVGAVSVLRTHALSGYSLALAQYTGGRVTLADGTGALLAAIASAAPVETLLATPVAAVRARDGGVEVETRDGELFEAAAVVVAVALN